MSENNEEKKDLPLANAIERTINLGEMSRPSNIEEIGRRAERVLSEESNSIELSKEQADKFSVLANFVTQGVLGTPLACDNTKCHYAPRCPLAEASHGKTCQLELFLIKTKFRQWAESIPGIDIKNALHMNFINQLISFDVQEFRLGLRLADPDRGNLTEQVVTVVDNDGNPYFETKVVAEIKHINKIHADRTKLLRELVVTPREHYKKMAALKENDEESQTKKLSSIKERMLNMRGDENE